jgi:hypothetical protein
LPEKVATEPEKPKIIGFGLRIFTLQVRYGWANSPQRNLFNVEELPASPYTSAP